MKTLLETTRLYFTLSHEKATKDFAGLLASHSNIGDIFLLLGDLGTGKSTFAQGFIRYFLPLQDEIPSPTFTLVQHYEFPQGRIDHYDLYRLETAEEITELGIENSYTNAITLVEWPDRLGQNLPRDYILIGFKTEQGDSEKRAVFMEGDLTRFSGISWPNGVEIRNSQ